MKHYKIGKTSKGASRLWIEGKILSDYGFNVGNHFNVEHGENKLVIRFDNNGKKKVSGNASRPIIDITGKTVTKGFDHIPESVTVYAINHMLTIEPNEV